MSDTVNLRTIALESAVKVSLQKGDADGQTVLRRANAFLNFLLKGEVPPPEKG